jgi:3-dehydroquinate synthase
MSDDIVITSQVSRYQVHFSSFSHLSFQDYRIIIADRYFQNHPYIQSSSVLFLDALEQTKSLENCKKILDFFMERKLTKQDIVLVIGGGIIQDIASFCCSIFLRGIRWHSVPTTLLAMVDTCIGGKNGVNFSEGKNLVGTIYPAEKVWIDVDFCQTLAQEQLICGFIEAAKTSYCHSKESFLSYYHFYESFKEKGQALSDIIYLSLSCKKYFIEKDEFDQTIRQHLNFGHTLGHAIESITHFQIPHGIAVGIGILMACELFQNTSDIVQKLKKHIMDLLKGSSEFVTLFHKAYKEDDFFEILKKDKKNPQNGIVLILPSQESGVSKQLFLNEEELRKQLSSIVDFTKTFNRGIQ